MKLGLQFRLLIGDLDSTAVDIIVPQVRDNECGVKLLYSNESNLSYSIF